MGRLTRARARATRWRWPPESCAGAAVAVAREPHRGQRLLGPGPRSALATLRTLRPYSTFASTDMCGNSA